MFSLICVWINGWVNNREAGDLRRRRAHYDVTVMLWRLTASTYALSSYCWTCCNETHMMTTSNRNIFRVTGPLWWVPTITCGFPSQRPVTRSLMFSLMCAWTNCWTNNGAPGGLRRHDAHCDGHCNDLYFWMQKYHLFVSGVNMYTWYITMMASSNGNIFRVTGHLCGEFTGPRWIPRTKASDAELWCFLWSASE